MRKLRLVGVDQWRQCLRDGMTPSQRLAALVLMQVGRPMSPSELRRICRFGSSTAYRTIRGLVKFGLVEMLPGNSGSHAPELSQVAEVTP